MRRIRDDGEDVLQDVTEVGLIKALGSSLFLGDVLKERVEDLQTCETKRRRGAKTSCKRLTNLLLPFKVSASLKNVRGELKRPTCYPLAVFKARKKAKDT